MEENQPKTGKYALTCGALFGGASIVFAIMLYSLDMHYQAGMMVFSVSAVITLAAIILALIQFRKDNNGQMTFGQGLKVGVGVCLIGGILSLLFNQVLMNFIDPDMMAKAIAFQKEQLLETTKMTSSQIDAQLEMGKKFQTPAMQIGFGLLYVIVSGFIFSLIPALVLKRTKNIN